MAQRKFLILSCLLITAAIVCQFTCLKHCARAMQLVARNVEASERGQGEVLAEADRINYVGRLYAMIGLPAAAVGLWLGIVARRRQEARWTVVPVLLMFLYVLSLTMIV